ncbi:MAG: ribosome recycling factor [Bacteroidales bacterium]|nr:ribosome recycling factor [Bacteroidales bacterium]
MSAYAVQYGYYLNNLCVKAEAAALLPVEVKVPGSPAVNIEDVAMAGLLDDYNYFIYPKNKAMMPFIEEGIKKVHPEFELSHGKLEDAPDDNNEQIIAKVPPVDDDRNKQLTEAVKNLTEVCKTQLDTTSKLYGARITTALLGESGDAQKEAKDAMQEICDWHDGLCKKYQENKEEEIKAAHEAWQNNGGQQEQKQDDSKDSAAFTMKMN